MIVLVVAALIPAVLLWSIFQWSAGEADASADAVPAPTDSLTPQPDGLPALNTSLLSYRRSAEQLSLDLNLAAFESAVGPLLSAVNDRSCVAVSLNGRLVGARNANTIVIPASNQKILVAAVALEILSEAFRYRTTAVAAAPVGGVISGDLFLVGGGDPLLSGTWYPTSNLDRFVAFNITPLDDLAIQLKSAGVTSIQGTVRGDGSRYDDELYAPGWAEGVQGLEAGPYDALLVNDSRVQGDDQRGADPNETGAREFVRILSEQGIAVTGGAGVGTAPPGGTVLATVESLPIAAAIAEMLTNSDNNTAELMVKEIGLAASGLGTRQAGLEAIAATIQSWGIDTTGMVLDDGSGLSLENRISCSTLLAVIQHVGFDSPVGQGLAVAGETGTLVEIFGDTVLKGRLRGKTGTLNNPPFNVDPPAVKALSGYLPVDGGGAIEYVLVLNGPTISDQSEYRSVWAELVTSLSSFPAVASPAALGPR
jgi:serine-type D-Ala-D-Ala carboxypeptidase/endopeptidase (penicillin-binding protein 4)